MHRFSATIQRLLKLYILVYVFTLLAACHNVSDAEHRDIQIQVPKAIQKMFGYEPGDIYLELRLNSEPTKTYQLTNGEWYLSDVDVLLNQQNSYVLMWFETFENRPLLLAEQAGAFFADSTIGSANLDAPHVTTGTNSNGISFDSDTDGFSNLSERVNGTNPFFDESSVNDCSIDPTDCIIELPRSGLVAYYEADRGITLSDDNGVVAWDDQSLQGNHLTGFENPTLEEATLNGQPVIDFSSESRLAMLAPIGLPTDNSDRSMFLLVQYRSGSFGGASFGNTERNQAFGLVSTANGLGVQGYAQDFLVPGEHRDQWLVQSAVLKDDMLSHYRDGNIIDVRDHVFATGNNILMVGSEIGSRPASMKIAAVLIYNRALTTNEQLTLHQYLESKYFDTEPN